MVFKSHKLCKVVIFVFAVYTDFIVYIVHLFV